MNVLIVGFSLGLSLAFLDVFLSILRKPSELARFSNLFAPIGASLLVFLVLFVATVAASRLLRPRIGRDRETSIRTRLVLLLATVFVVAAVARLFSVGSGLPVTIWFTVVLEASLVLVAIAYVVVPNLRDAEPGERRGLWPCLAAPAILFELLVMIWMLSYRKSGFLPLEAALLTLGYFCLALATIVVCRRVTNPGAVLGSLATAAVLACISSIVIAGNLIGARHTGPVVVHADSIPKHVILITVDTLRPDCLSCYRAEADPTRHIDALAADGFLFKNAYSSAPWTLPAMASIMTGVSPFVHLLQKFNSRLPSTLPTLADNMQTAGYQTAAIGRSPTLNPNTNLGKGFLDYDMFPKPGYGASLGAAMLKVALAGSGRWDVSTDALTDDAIRWLQSNAKRDFFLWLHYFDPHEPYAPPAPFLPPGTPEPRIGVSCSHADDIRSGYFVPMRAERTWIKALYEGEVRLVDANVGRVVEALRRIEIYDDALIVFTSDHGEEFWEHGAFEHGHCVYDEVIRVPLVVKLPRQTNRGESDVVVSTASIMPTVLDLCKIPFDWDAYDVGSLVPIVSGHPEAYEPRVVTSSGTLYYENRTAIFFDGLKYILSFGSGREELFDLASDPGETVSIAKQRPDAIQQAMALLKERGLRSARLRERFEIEGRERSETDGETLEELRSLGYVR